MDTYKKPTARWTVADRQAFADGNILRARRQGNRRREAARRACRRGNWD